MYVCVFVCRVQVVVVVVAVVVVVVVRIDPSVVKCVHVLNGARVYYVCMRVKKGGKGGGKVYMYQI